jgi:hypothetical protein
LTLPAAPGRVFFSASLPLSAREPLLAKRSLHKQTGVFISRSRVFPYEAMTIVCSTPRKVSPDLE